MSPDQLDAEPEASLRAQLAAKDARNAEQDEVIAAQAVRIAAQDVRIALLEKLVAELLEKLGRNSGNSNLPPSSDRPGERAGQKTGAGKRSRGGQKRHRGSRRALLPVEKVDDVVDLFSAQCGACSLSLPEVIDRWASAAR